MAPYRRPLNRSITIGCIMFIVVLCALLSMANLNLYRQYVYDDYKGYIDDILNYTMSHIDADDLETCIKTGTESAKYKETLLFMDDFIDHFNDVHYFYAVRPLNTEDTGNVMSVLSAERYYDRYVDTEGNLYLGWVSDDEFDSETAAKFFEIMNGSEIVYFEQATEWGTDYTGAVPIKNSKGEGIAVLAVDVDISFINGMVFRYAMVNIGIILAVGIIFIVLFVAWSRRNVTRPIGQLEKSASGFAATSSGQRDVDALNFDAPSIKADNEIKALSNAVVKMTANMRDYVSDVVNAEREAASMQELARRDALTGTRNKTAYDADVKRLDEAIGQGDTKVGLAVVDLNFLKQVNDTYGHDKGNIAIQTLSQLVCVVFEHSAVYRIGGDEFAIVLRGYDYDHCDEIVARFDGMLERKANDAELRPWERISAAVGVAFYDEKLDDGMEGLFRRADRNMYERKKAMKASREA